MHLGEAHPRVSVRAADAAESPLFRTILSFSQQREPHGPGVTVASSLQMKASERERAERGETRWGLDRAIRGKQGQLFVKDNRS